MLGLMLVLKSHSLVIQDQIYTGQGLAGLNIILGTLGMKTE